LWYEKLKEKPETYMNAKSINLIRSSVTHTHIHAHRQKLFQFSIGVHPTNQTGQWFRPTLNMFWLMVLVQMSGLGRVFFSVCAQHLESHVAVQS